MRRRPARTVPVCLALVVLLLGGLAACSDDASDGATATTVPMLDDPSVTGRELVTEFMSILQRADVEALDGFLAEGFVVQRADGSTATRDEYLAAPIAVSAFELGPEVLGTQNDDVMVVRWSVTASEATADGTFGTEVAPRLSTFVWRDGTWKMISHANFNTIPEAPTSAA